MPHFPPLRLSRLKFAILNTDKQNMPHVNKQVAELSLQLLTIKQTQEYMKCSHVFIWNRRNEGLIETVRAGRKILIPKASIDKFLQLNKELSNG